MAGEEQGDSGGASGRLGEWTPVAAEGREVLSRCLT